MYYDSLNYCSDLFCFTSLVNNCKPVFRFRKTSKDAKFTQCFGKCHISILSTRNVIWTLGGVGGGRVGACDVSRWKSWKISMVCSKIFIFWNHLYKIQHFVSVFTFQVYLYVHSQVLPSPHGSRQSRKKYVTFLRRGGGGGGVSRRTSIWRFSWTKSICDASLTYGVPFIASRTDAQKEL